MIQDQVFVVIIIPWLFPGQTTKYKIKFITRKYSYISVITCINGRKLKIYDYFG